MKFIKIIILALILFYSLPSKSFAISCGSGISKSYGLGWPSYLAQIARSSKNYYLDIKSSSSGSGLSRHDTCLASRVSGEPRHLVQCLGVFCDGPLNNTEIKSFDGTTFKLSDGRWLDLTANIIAPDCLLKPLDFNFANGWRNDPEETDTHLITFKNKIEKEMEEKNITNDKEAHPTCTDVQFNPLFHEHTFEEFVKNELIDKNRSVDDFEDRDLFEEAYKETVTNSTDPLTVQEQTDSLNYSRDGQQVTTIIIAHSQGNKVANKIYELSSLGNKPGILAIATPESNVADGSDHITSTNDTVISVLATGAKIFLGDPLPLTGNILDTDIPLDAQHGLDYYLREGSETRQAICDRIKAELAKPGFVGPIPQPTPDPTPDPVPDPDPAPDPTPIPDPPCCDGGD